MSDDDWVMGALAAQDEYQPVEKPWQKYDVAQLQSDDADRMPFGVGSPAESAHAPSGIDQVVRHGPSVLGQVARGAYTALGETAKGAFEQSELLRSGEGYNAKPAVEAALMTMGGPLVGGTKAAAEGGVVLGSGPIKAYHSSPHTFDKFDTSRIGTGEGAQVYGHGLYFAENPAVSGQGGQYWNDFRHRFGGNEGKAAELLQQHGFDRSKALKVLNEEIEQARALPTDKMFNEVAKQSHIDQLLARQRLLASDKPVGPRTYEVDINADPSHMLDWDKPLHQQPHVEDALFSKFLDQMSRKKATEELDLYQKKTGDVIYRALARDMSKPEASELLASEGIPGIKYLDEGSRNTALAPYWKLVREKDNATVREITNEDRAKAALAEMQGGFRLEGPIDKRTRNYVVFDPKIIDIRKMYGIGGIGAGLGAAYGMGDIASQGKYEQQL